METGHLVKERRPPIDLEKQTGRQPELSATTIGISIEINGFNPLGDFGPVPGVRGITWGLASYPCVRLPKNKNIRGRTF